MPQRRVRALPRQRLVTLGRILVDPVLRAFLLAIRFLPRDDIVEVILAIGDVLEELYDRHLTLFEDVHTQ